MTTTKRRVRPAAEIPGTVHLKLSPHEQAVLLQLIADSTEISEDELFTLMKLEQRLKKAAALSNNFANTPVTN